MVRINSNVYVLFFKEITPSWNNKSLHSLFQSLWRFLAIFIQNRYTIIEHCGIMLECDDGIRALYQTSKGGKSRFRVCNAFLTKYPPDCMIYVGNVDFDPDGLYRFPSVRFNVYSGMLWYWFTRWFSDWKPRENCTMQSSKLLKFLNIQCREHVLPYDLYKELKSNAHDNDCWEGSGWQDYLGKYNC